MTALAAILFPILSFLRSRQKKKFNYFYDEKKTQLSRRQKKTLIAVFVHSRFHIIFFVYFAVEIVHLSASKCACGVLKCACASVCERA